jgi:hypothetical protein
VGEVAKEEAAFRSLDHFCLWFVFKCLNFLRTLTSTTITQSSGIKSRLGEDDYDEDEQEDEQNCCCARN